jgi:hypothetical protein
MMKMIVDNLIIIVFKILRIARILILTLKINNIENQFVQKFSANIILWNKLFMRIMRKHNKR